MNKQHTIDSQLRKYPPSWPQFVFFAIGAVLFVVLWLESVIPANFSKQGVRMIGLAFKGLVTPSLDVFIRLDQKNVFYMLFETFAIGFLGTVFGTIFAIPLAFVSSRNIAPRWVNLIVLAVITVIRAFPSIMYGIMFVKAVGPGAFAGVLTMTVGSIGMLAKLMVESIEDINPGIVESLDAAGCTGFQKVRYGIMPQLSSSIISTVLYRLDINVKNASVLGLVGAGGIGAQLIFAIQDRRWSDAGAMLWGLVILVLLIEVISTRIRNALAGKD